MLIVALVLAVIGLAALVTAVVTSNELIAWVCIGASVIGVLLLIVDALRDRKHDAPGADEPDRDADEQTTVLPAAEDYPDEPTTHLPAVEDEPDTRAADTQVSATPAADGRGSEVETGNGATGDGATGDSATSDAATSDAATAAESIDHTPDATRNERA